MYDPEIYRHQIPEYYNPYVLDTDIPAGEFDSDSAGFEPGAFSLTLIEILRKKTKGTQKKQISTPPTQFAYATLIHPPLMTNFASLVFCPF